MKIYKLIGLIIVALLSVTCSRYIKVNDYDGHDTYVYKGNRKNMTETNFYPFERSWDTTFTGYKIVYTAEDRKARAYVFDTIPFCGKNNKSVSNTIYEVYYYKGQPRFTKEVGRFMEGGFRHQNRKIIDVKNWEKQVELGLTEKPPKLTIKYPILSKKFESDTTNYTANDIEYMLKGHIRRNNVSYGINDSDSSYIYLRKDGFTRLSATPSRIFVKQPDKTRKMIPFWISDFPENLSELNVFPNENVSAMFHLIPDSLLNSKSCEFSFDNIAYKNTKYSPPEYYAEFINIKFKDGNYKTWLYHKYEDDSINILNKYPWMRKFIDDIEFLYFLPPSNYQEYIDYDFTLGDTCCQKSIQIR
ncbi:hypothetical protein M2451_002920 [Dysgonomonas sp. PFB1-18]|uniref:hypothetical protein n=1 Tax=unclassified Dysgonomonas TaxID=2630389 RepID=UPI0013D6B5E1|nr:MULTISPECIES: hypothetical protein [unclassified Dysgonomonas]MDH6310030.1 hypothetical protein [Dysgonomonas sp. PF1-14]MDH6339939.1 hypothetical protein [Dysgonomonas sp. PF1-16]MDH6381587.1 hypothetical protein [Dysgonomonas sp. PFB1-18]MDH6398776.1 hypothetical protein [Dysgonomonas sp. PF1-23]NDV93621.1 hypothetical protein [Dysgonomonas sp. 521]